jgi:hypothetical protein
MQTELENNQTFDDNIFYNGPRATWNIFKDIENVQDVSNKDKENIVAAPKEEQIMVKKCPVF